MTTKGLLLALILAVSFSGAAFAKSQKKKEEPQAILVSSFGTSMESARAEIDNLVNSVKAAFPSAEVRLSFSSNIIRRKLAKEGEKNIPPSPSIALAQLNDEGFKKVCVMPTHIIPGAEYDDVKGVVDAFRTIKGKYGFADLRMGKPFLSSVAACDEFANALVKRFENVPSPGNVPPDTAVVLMGHGTPHHFANAMYCQLQVSLEKLAENRFFIGTVENTPLIKDVIASLKKCGYKKVLISPLMEVAGDHANNDLAGEDDPESWLNLLKAEGFSVETRIEGLGSDPLFASLFVEHLKSALK